jgi:hypothetical protein
MEGEKKGVKVVLSLPLPVFYNTNDFYYWISFKSGFA